MCDIEWQETSVLGVFLSTIKLINSDNSTTIINSMGGTKSPSSNKRVQDIWTWCMQNKTWLNSTSLQGPSGYQPSS